MDELFQSLIGKPGATLYKFQKQVVNSLLYGRNVILSAPTGAGKTWAALIPYLKSKFERKPFVDRVFYALPLRSLASSLFISTLDDCKNVFVVNKNAIAKRYDNKEICITIQTGEQQEDRYFQGDICFTTIDQLLAGYLNIPLSLSPRMVNINAGAYIGSLVVLDEVHLLDPEKSFATVLEMVDRLKPYTQFLLMTATLSSNAISILKEHIDADVITVSQEELMNMPSHRDKEREYRWVGEPLSASNILKHHSNGRTIVVCNTVARAQEIYKNIKEELPAGCHLILLHSRFYPEHRRVKEYELALYLGPRAIKTNVILVATQVIEAGIDISADNLHTELCTANALLQRAGRCARYSAPRNKGTVWVYELEQTSNGQYKLGPYSKENADLVRKTREIIIKRNGSCLYFSDEQKLIDEVHVNEVNALLGICQSISSWRKKVDEAIDTGNPALIRELIRDIQSINIILTGDPVEILFEKHPQMLSIPATSLYTIKKFLGREGDRPIGWYPVEHDQETADLSLSWDPITSKQQLQNAWLLALSPNVASYCSELGLCLGEPGCAVPIRYKEKSGFKPYGYQIESYITHANATLKFNRKNITCHQNGLEKLEFNLHLPAGIVAKLVDLICVLHDSGKLTQKWQDGIWSWQTDYYPIDAENFKGQPLAHSTFRPENGDIKRQKNRSYDRGTHAAEGAFMVANGIYDWLLAETDHEELAQILTMICITTIARHHSARTKDVSDYILWPGAKHWIGKSLEPLGISKYFSELIVPVGKSGKKDFQKMMITAGNNREWLALYWFLVRRVRLADQNSLAI
ncbi:CRISPR-associated helicase Cas3' [Desulfotruncus alcoholivorax]|uniref:CRISPR-associated helicase Cas3' n=1 Tax=Desulfotruncus alcoholivorax TaxID=265477 RepID=UPI000404E097|nr:CRISPR-associated helicase Cas3' [Desulfotruncus alcoholivorax]